jgi:hypothetical protein
MRASSQSYSVLCLSPSYHMEPEAVQVGACRVCGPSLATRDSVRAVCGSSHTAFRSIKQIGPLLAAIDKVSSSHLTCSSF